MRQQQQLQQQQQQNAQLQQPQLQQPQILMDLLQRTISLQSDVRTLREEVALQRQQQQPTHLTTSTTTTSPNPQLSGEGCRGCSSEKLDIPHVAGLMDHVNIVGWYK